MTNDKLKMTNESIPRFIRDLLYKVAKRHLHLIRQRRNIGHLTLLLILVIGIWSLVISAPAHAVTFTATGNPDDTASGTLITAEAANETLNYTDINDNPKSQETPGTNITITVLPVYGFSAGMMGNLSLYVAQTVTNSNSITNEGNNSDTYSMGHSCNFANAGAGTWTVNIRRTSDNSLIGTLTVGSPTTSESKAVAEDADYGFYHQVTAPADGTQSAYLTITSTASTASTPVGQYAGANGLTYGGQASTSDATVYTIAAPLLTLTRTSTVDAPAAGAYTGGARDVVPGAVITYTMTYSNTGNSSAESVILVDKIPPYAKLAHFSKITCTQITSINGGVKETASGWAVYYSTEVAPQKYYGNATGWTSIYTTDAGVTVMPAGATTYTYSDGAYGALWVKWEKLYVDPSEDSKTLVWGVTVR